MPTKIIYDFSDYIPHEEEWQRLAESLIRSEVKSAFDAFANEGEWWFRKRDGGIEWTANFDGEIWGSGFPIEIVVSPQEFVAAVKEQIANYQSDSEGARRLFGGAVEIKDALEKWRAALAECEAALIAAGAGTCSINE